MEKMGKGGGGGEEKRLDSQIVINYCLEVLFTMTVIVRAQPTDL